MRLKAIIIQGEGDIGLLFTLDPKVFKKRRFLIRLPNNFFQNKFLFDGLLCLNVSTNNCNLKKG